MKLLLGALLVSIACVRGSWFDDWFGSDEVDAVEVTNPEFCKGKECPQYKVVQKFKDGTFEFELRRYKPTTWIYAEIPEMDHIYWEDRSYETNTFRKLMRYIQGANNQNMTMDATVPVLKEHHNSSVYMCFMVPEAQADNPPTPTDSDVVVVNVEQRDLYVSSFDGLAYGWFGENYFKSKAVDLYFHLMRNELEFDKNMFYTATYDPNWRLFNRHNEVWYRKEDAPSSYIPE